jgi:hypothetical protein
LCLAGEGDCLHREYPPRLWRTVALAVLLGAVCGAPAHGQQAILPRKGRQADRTAPTPAEPVRRLPERLTGRPIEPRPALAGQPPPSPDFGPHTPDRPQSDDRLRPLVRGEAMPLPLLDETWIRVLPQPPILVAEAVTPSVATRATPVRNRWKIFPSPPWRRYDNAHLDAIYSPSSLWDPFNRNTIKGDYPIVGRRVFFDFTGSSETLVEQRREPAATGASTASSGEPGFFGNGDQFAVQQNFRLSFDLFRGDAGFRPIDWELRVTPEFNINYTLAQENGVTSIDVANGASRTATSIGMQEAFFEKRLFTNSPEALRQATSTDDNGSAYFDFTSLRLGIQRFTSDFRGFVFSDEQPGARLFGTFDNNILQYNLAYFNMLEKDSNSGLNRWQRRNQSVYAANLYWSDVIAKGYTLNFSTLYNNDQPGFLIDQNGFLVRPAPIGTPVPHKVRAGYAGISGQGHIGRINVSHTFYEAFGRDDFNPIPPTVYSKNAQHINAQMAALELAYEKDWMTFKISGFYTSGERNLKGGEATGFDAIVPNQQFAGGGFLGNPALADRGLIDNLFAGGGINFLNREPIPLTGTGVLLFGPNSLIPSMRAGQFEGQANFDNPGILLFNAGYDAKIAPKLKASLNVNWAKFNDTEVLETVLFQPNIRHDIGLDSGLGLQYRPLLNDNIVVTTGFGALVPGGGFKDIYNGRTLFSAFVNVRMVF